MLVAEVDLIRSLGLGVMYDLDLILISREKVRLVAGYERYSLAIQISLCQCVGSYTF